MPFAQNLHGFRPPPVAAWAYAGYGNRRHDPCTRAKAWPTTPGNGPNACGIIIETDSTEPRFLAGDRVVCEPNSEPRTGRLVAANLRDTSEHFIKRFYRKGPEGQLVRLESTNPAYPPSNAPLRFRVDPPRLQNRKERPMMQASCRTCGGQVELENGQVGQTLNCPHCHRDSTFAPLRFSAEAPIKLSYGQLQPTALASTFEGERLLHEDTRSGVSVTSRRFCFGGNTVQLANVSMVSTSINRPRLWPWIVVAALGLLTLLPTMLDRTGSDQVRSARHTSLCLLSAGALAIATRQLRTKYLVVLTLNSGESTTYETRKQSAAREVATALNEAIATR